MSKEHTIPVVLTLNRSSIRCGHPVTVKLLLCARKTGNRLSLLALSTVMTESYSLVIMTLVLARRLWVGERDADSYAGILSSVKLSAFATDNTSGCYFATPAKMSDYVKKTFQFITVCNGSMNHRKQKTVKIILGLNLGLYHHVLNSFAFTRRAVLNRYL